MSNTLIDLIRIDKEWKLKVTSTLTDEVLFTCNVEDIIIRLNKDTMYGLYDTTPYIRKR